MQSKIRHILFRMFSNIILISIFIIPNFTVLANFSKAEDGVFRKNDISNSFDTREILTRLQVKLNDVKLPNLSALDDFKNTSEKEMKTYFLSFLNQTGISENEFKYLHYNRNKLQKKTAPPINEIYDFEKNIGKSGFKKLSDEKSIFHQVGEYNSQNWKFVRVNSDGSSEEYVYRKILNNKNEEVWDIVADPVNVGTFNIVDESVAAGYFSAKGIPHVVWDVLPYLIWGNSQGDKTRYEWRRNFYMAGVYYKAASLPPFSYVRGTKDEDALITSLQSSLSCNCNNTDYNNNGKGDLGGKEPATNPNAPFVAFLSYFSKWTQPNGQGGTLSGVDHDRKGVLFQNNVPAPPKGTVVFKNFREATATSDFNVESVVSPQASNQDNLQEANRYGPGVFRNLANWNSTVAGTNYDRQNYTHTAWGRWNGVISDDWGNGTQNVATKGYWVGGKYSASPVIDAKTGAANYKGALIGDFLARNTTTVETGVAYGKINLDMDFTSNTLTGGMNIFLNRSGTTTSWLNPAITNGTISPYFEEHGQVVGPVFFGDVGSQSGFQDGEGPRLVGFFFGPYGTEVGGAFDAIKATGTDAGTVNGVFRAQEQPQ
jgi:hypothetical protein